MRILLLDLDTLRPDHLGCYGYHRNTSPNIDSIAADGIRFSNYYCSDAPCLPSRSALMTGQFGIRSGVVGHGGTTADPRLEGPARGFSSALADAHGGGYALPMIFRRAGMKTASISPFAERHGAWWFNAGFSEVFNTGKGGNESAEDVTPVVLKWLEDNGRNDNWLLHVNYWDAHDPYRVPPAFGNPFENEPPPSWITEEILNTHRQSIGPSTARELNMFSADAAEGFPRDIPEIRTLENWKKHIDGYDCGIAYMDQQVGFILEALDRAGVRDETAIIITSDHGENHGELGIYKEHGTADQATCRIPMIIKWPDGVQGHVDTGLHYNLDLVPTLSALLEQQPQSSWDGESYSPAIVEGGECSRDNLVLSQCAHVCQRSVRFGPWLYIRTYHGGFHLFSEEMLFNLEEDPHEQNNLADLLPEVCREAADILNRWHDERMADLPDAVDPLQTVLREGGPYHPKGNLRKYCRRLEATDRGWAVVELKRRHPGEFE